MKRPSCLAGCRVGYHAGSQARSHIHEQATIQYRTRRGITFIESILSVILLAMVVTTMSSAVSFMTRSQRYMDQRLGAGELANRLILQYMDDPESLPDRSLPIEYDIDLYRWTLDEDKVRFRFEEQLANEADSGVGGGANLDRIKLITVRVWLAADSGGSRSYSQDVPNITVTRLIDPLNFFNPDSFETMLEQPGGFERLIESLLDIEEGAP